ncbi:MAG: protein kinase [Myxococcota bacterium]
MLRASPFAVPLASVTTPLRVLHVEGDDVEHAIVARLIGRAAGAGVELRRVRTVAEALAALQEAPADVLLLDLDAKADGPGDALDAMLHQRIGVPIVAVDGDADPGAAVDVIGRGAEDVLSKNELDASRLWNALVHAYTRWRRTPTPYPSLPSSVRLAPTRGAAALAVGTTIERYTVEGVIGRGGMATVYRVRHRTLGSEHALKVVRAGKSDDGRLLREGQAQARLRHPNLVMATDVLQLDGGIALVMEYVQGPTLLQWLRQGRTPAAPWLDLFRGVVRGVRHAHAHGLVHRDLKPANVLLQIASEPVLPKVTDFGIAKALTPAREHGELEADLTAEHSALGTPGYMAPEQVCDAAGVDQRADLFSLGCILYDLACGRSAFRGKDRNAILAAATRASYPRPTDHAPDLPKAVVEVIDGLLVVDPRRRIPDCDTLLSALDGVRIAGAMESPEPPGERYTRWRSTAQTVSG